MTYEVNFTDPAKSPIIIPSRSVNTTNTDVALFGYTNLEYGKPLNETFLHLLENFATPARGTGGIASSQPTVDPLVNKFLKNPTEGQYWFNKTRNSLFVYHSSEWHEIAMGSHVAANWGVITDGQTIPRPISRFGYEFPYSECSWSVSPRRFTAEPSWFTCLTDDQAAVSASVRYTGSAAVTGMSVNYLILGVKNSSSVGTVRSIPCPPTAVTVGFRAPMTPPTTMETTQTLAFDLEGVVSPGTQGPVTYAWQLLATSGSSTTEVPASNLWDVTVTAGAGLNQARIIGTIRKADPTTTTRQKMIFRVTTLDGCGQSASRDYLIDTAFTQRALPSVTVINCARTLTSVDTVGDTSTNHTHTLEARWDTTPPQGVMVEWQAPVATGTPCSEITPTVLVPNPVRPMDHVVRYAVSPRSTPGTAACTFTHTYRVVDELTGVRSAPLTCTSTINHTTHAQTTLPPLSLAFAASPTRNIGNLGGSATSVTSGAPTAAGGTGPYTYALVSSNTTACTTASTAVTGVTVSPTTGAVSFTATPPATGTTTGSCDVSVTVRVTDSIGGTATAVMTRRLSWGVPDQSYVNSITRTCPATITIMSAGASDGSRTATVTIPVVVRNQSGAVMSSGFALDWTVTTSCNVTLSGTSGTITNVAGSTNVTFTARVPRNSSFSCSSTTVSITARNTDATWSPVTHTATCPVTIVADAYVAVPLSVTFSSASTTTGTSQTCDGVASSSVATIIGTIAGGDAPYALSGTGYSLAGLSCAAGSYVTAATITGNVITATVRMPAGTNAQTCNGTINLLVRDASNNTASMGARAFSLVRTLCVPACWTGDPSGVVVSGTSTFCAGVQCSNTPTGPLVYFTRLDPDTGYNPCGTACACANATSYSTTGGISNTPTRGGATRYNPTPCAVAGVKITIPGVGEAPLLVRCIAPTNTASSTSHATGSVVVGGRTFTMRVNLTATLTSQHSTGKNWTLSTSWTVTPAIPQCANSGGNPPGPPGGPGGPGGPGCFAEDSHVMLADGSTIRIADVEPGMELRSLDVGVGSNDPHDWRQWGPDTLVESTMTTSVVVGVRRLVSPTHIVLNGNVKGTHYHPLLVHRTGGWRWVNMGQVRVGDLLYSTTRGSIPINTIERVNAPLPVVGVDVENVDTYFVGARDSLFLVHNKDYDQLPL